MNTDSTRIDVGTFVAHVVSVGAWSTKGRLRFHVEQIFKGVDFAGKSVLDIGGGIGLLSFYAGVMGAQHVICLDPEASGSTSGMRHTFAKLSAGLPLDNVRFQSADFQSFDNGGMTFDVVILYNSINHLNEGACISLRESTESRRAYEDIFARLRSMMAAGAQIIVCDCGRSNFFQLIGVTNPFAPSIEWEKHQNPIVWQRMLADVGFRNPKIRWRSFSALRGPGRFLLANPLAAYFFESHFCLSMELEA